MHFEMLEEINVLNGRTNGWAQLTQKTERRGKQRRNGKGKRREEKRRTEQNRTEQNRTEQNRTEHEDKFLKYHFRKKQSGLWELIFKKAGVVKNGSEGCGDEQTTWPTSRDVKGTSMPTLPDTVVYTNDSEPPGMRVAF